MKIEYIFLYITYWSIQIFYPHCITKKICPPSKDRRETCLKRRPKRCLSAIGEGVPKNLDDYY